MFTLTRKVYKSQSRQARFNLLSSPKMLQAVSLTVLLALSVSSAPVCETSLKMLTSSFEQTLANQTEIIDDLANYVQKEFDAGHEYEVSSRYVHVKQPINLLQDMIESAIKSDISIDQIKKLDIDSLVKKFETLKSKETMKNNYPREMVDQLKKIQKEVQDASSTNSSKSCEDKLKDLIDILAKSMYMASNEMSSVLADVVRSLYSMGNPNEVAEQQLAICNKAASLIKNVSDKFGQLDLNEQQKRGYDSKLPVTIFTLKNAMNYVNEIASKSNSQTAQQLKSSVETTIANLEAIVKEF